MVGFVVKEEMFGLDDVKGDVGGRDDAVDGLGSDDDTEVAPACTSREPKAAAPDGAQPFYTDTNDADGQGNGCK